MRHFVYPVQRHLKVFNVILELLRGTGLVERQRRDPRLYRVSTLLLLGNVPSTIGLSVTVVSGVRKYFSEPLLGYTGAL